MSINQYASRSGAERTYIVNPIRINGIDYVAGNGGIDAATQSLQFVDYEHHEVHSGSHYEGEFSLQRSINAVFDLQITTPNKTSWAHMTFNISCEAETDWEIYENVSIVTPGLTTYTPINNNRNSTNTSGLTIKGSVNSSEANAEADTDTSGATTLARGIIGAGKDGGVSARNREFILKQNEDYSLRISATAAGYKNIMLAWYEHTNKN